MFRVGLTGGIASGKTTVANIFADLGAAIVDTDVIAREVVAPGQPGLAAVVDAFGPSVLLDSGELDRAALRKIVFHDAERRRVLETILHPLIRAQAMRQIDAVVAPYVVVVVPLLLESGFAELVDRIVVVDCQGTQQLDRLRRRDRIDAREAQTMLNAQTARSARLAKADDVVDNSGDLAATRAQVESLHALYLELAASVP